MRETEIKEIVKQDDIYFACLATLAMVEDNPTFSLTSELAYLCDVESLSKMVKCLGGRTITIPTEEQLKLQLRSILLHQYYTVNKMEWKDALEKAGFSRSEGRKAARVLSKLESALDENKIKFGGICNGIFDK